MGPDLQQKQRASWISKGGSAKPDRRRRPTTYVLIEVGGLGEASRAVRTLERLDVVMRASVDRERAREREGLGAAVMVADVRLCRKAVQKGVSDLPEGQSEAERTVGRVPADVLLKGRRFGKGLAAERADERLVAGVRLEVAHNLLLALEDGCRRGGQKLAVSRV